MSKKIFSMIMSLIVATSLIGCGSVNKSENVKENSKTASVENKSINEASDEDKNLEGKWAKDYTLDEVKGFYKEYSGKMEEITKGFGLEYSKDETIKGENDEKVTDNCIYFDNKNPEKNKIESMYFGMKTYGEDLTSGDITLKLSLKFDGEDAIKNNDFDLGKTAFNKYISAFTGEENRDYSDLNKQIIDGLKNGDNEFNIKNTIDGLKEEVIVSKEYIIYKLSTKKYIFADAEMSME